MNRYSSIDRDDIEQAIEIACGDNISGEQQRPRTASKNDTNRFRARLKRFLHELPEGTSVSDMIEAFEE